MITETFSSGMIAALLSGALVFVPAVLIGPRTQLRARSSALALCLALFVADMLCIYAPTLLGATGLWWAWTGKLAELALIGACLWAWPLQRAALRWPASRQWPWMTLAVALAVTLPSVLAAAGPRELPGWSYLAYQGLMPGLAEELMYRGLLLGWLDRQFGRPLKWLGVEWGWGAVLTTVLFYLSHALSYGSEAGFAIELASLPDFAIFGLAMCWLRYRFDSVWPSIIAHNLSNCALPYLVFALG